MCHGSKPRCMGIGNAVGVTIAAPGYPCDLLNGYPEPRGWDEAVAADGTARHASRSAFDALAAHDLETLATDVRERMAEAEVAFQSDEGDAAFLVDPVPRVLAADEWAVLEAGLAPARARARRASSPTSTARSRSSRQGVVPAPRARAAPTTTSRRCAACRHAGRRWITVAGLDVVRDPNGAFRVLEDNLRTPSGFAYAVAARTARRGRPATRRRARARSTRSPALLGAALRSAAPEGVDEPRIAVLSDGPTNSAWWEHRWAGRALGVEVLVARRPDACATARSWPCADGAARSTSSTGATDADTLATDVGQLLLEPCSRGTLGVANAFGTGVADDKLMHAYVEDMVRFYLGEEPLYRVRRDLRPRAARRRSSRALDRSTSLVLKPRAGHGGVGVLIGPRAARAEIERAARRGARGARAAAIAQRAVFLSTHPTVIDGRLEPRHVDLRPVHLPDADGEAHVLPGGLTRVAFDDGEMVVNSSQNGGAKDTWVAAREAVRPLIGVTTSEVRMGHRTSPLPEGDPPQREMALGLPYARAVERAGGLPVVLPPLESDAIARSLEHLSGVCLSGGPDLSPAATARARTTSSGRPSPTSTLFELELARSADALGLPLLGICRGAQALNVARGGTLYQHLPDVTDGSIAAPPGGAGRPADARRSGSSAGSRLAGILGVAELPRSTPSTTRPSTASARGLRAVGLRRPTASSRRSRPRRRRTSAACSGTPRRSSTAPRTSRCSRDLVDAARGRGARRRHGERGGGMNHWSDWSPVAAESPWSVGVEEEVMLLDPRDWQLASVHDAVLAAADNDSGRPRPGDARLRASSSPPARTPTWPRPSPSCRRCARACARRSRRCGLAGGRRRARTRSRSGRTSTSPPASASSRSTRRCASSPAASRRSRLHVHVAVPDPEAAVRAMNRMRAHLPLLLALSANSPFWQGRDTGLASARVPLFGAFPRSGIPREFDDYARLVAGDGPADPLRRVPRADVHLVGRAPAAALRDARGPDHGRADARRRHGRARRARAGARAPRGRGRAGAARARRRARGARGEPLPGRCATASDAQLLDPRAAARGPVREVLGDMLEACAPLAAELGGAAELRPSHALDLGRRASGAAARAGGRPPAARGRAG